MICHSCNLSKSDYQYLVYVYRWLSLSRWVRHRCIIAWRRHLQVEGKLPSDNSILPPWRRKAGATKYEHRARLASLSTNSTLAGTVRDARAINVRRYTNDGDFRMRRSVVLTTFDLVWRTDGCGKWRRNVCGRWSGCWNVGRANSNRRYTHTRKP